MTKFGTLCSRLLHHHRIARPLTNHLIPITRNYSAGPPSSDSPSDDADVESRLKLMHTHYYDQVLTLKDDLTEQGKSTADIDELLAALPLVDLEPVAKDYRDPCDPDLSDEDEDDRQAKLKEDELREKRMDRYRAVADTFTNHITQGAAKDAYECVKQMDKLNNKICPPRMEYEVIGELLGRLKVAEGKEKFLLQMKLNRALRMADHREAFDPFKPANYGTIKDEQASFIDPDEDDENKNKSKKDDDDFDDMREKDTVLVRKLSELDKKLEEKLAELDHTFGKKGKLLEEEIRELAEERNSLTEQKRQPFYRKGFDVKLIDVNRTCKVTKGGQIFKYTVMLACGNYNGAVGFAKAKGSAIPVALQKAYEKCFQNLHYIEMHEDHTIAHAIQTSYKKTKVYLWPASAQTGMKAGRTVEIILTLAGFKNVKSKVIGSRNPHNTVKAVFKALNAIETPKDVQQQFGRTVVESYLL